MTRRRDDDDEGDAEECPFCHKMIAKDRYRKHVQKHQDLREDGQMTDHVTLAPEKRRKGKLDGVPRVYEHKKCRERTVMPDEIVRSYLQNPFLYNDETFCCGCNTYVKMRTCSWIETGQSLSDYFDELKAEAIRDGCGPKPLPEALKVGGLVGILAAMGLMIGGANVFGGPGAIGGVVLGVLVGVGVGGVKMVSQMSRAVPRRDDGDDRPQKKRKKRPRDEDDD